MSHIFADKIFVFIGKLQRCTRQEARDALTDVESVVDGHIAYKSYSFCGMCRTRTISRSSSISSLS